MKMHEAAKTVLESSGRAMHVRDIYREIVRKGLFAFGAKDPVAVLSNTLRKHSRKANPEESTFVQMGGGVFGLRGREYPR